MDCNILKTSLLPAIKQTLPLWIYKTVASDGRKKTVLPFFFYFLFFKLKFWKKRKCNDDSHHLKSWLIIISISGRIRFQKDAGCNEKPIVSPSPSPHPPSPLSFPHSNSFSTFRPSLFHLYCYFFFIPPPFFFPSFHFLRRCVISNRSFFFDDENKSFLIFTFFIFLSI